MVIKIAKEIKDIIKGRIYMTYLKNLKENESGEMEGEVYFSAIKQSISPMK